MTELLDRRSALQGLVVLAASAAVPQAWAGVSQAQAASPVSRLLLDPRLASTEWRGLVGAQEHRGSPVVLEAELVRQWRRGLWAELHASGGPVRALVRWDHALVLQGLVREERCQATVTQCGPALFEVRFNA
jgi:hypothetical protein